MGIDSLHDVHYRRGDASCISVWQHTTPLRNQSEQRFGTQLGNLIDSGLKGFRLLFRLPFQHGSGRTDVGTLPRFSASGRSPSGNARLLGLASLCDSGNGLLGFALSNARLFGLASLCFSGNGLLGFAVSMLLQGLQHDVRFSAAVPTRSRPTTRITQSEPPGNIIRPSSDASSFSFSIFSIQQGGGIAMYD